MGGFARRALGNLMPPAADADSDPLLAALATEASSSACSSVPSGTARSTWPSLLAGLPSVATRATAHALA
jgi:hypothetical protein